MVHNGINCVLRAIVHPLRYSRGHLVLTGSTCFSIPLPLLPSHLAHFPLDADRQDRLESSRIVHTTAKGRPNIQLHHLSLTHYQSRPRLYG